MARESIKELLEKVKNGPIPTHVAVILDGNRRWAKKNGLPPHVGHVRGAERVVKFLTWAYDLGIKAVTLYVLSTENIARRSIEELENILNLLEIYLYKMVKEQILHRYKVRFKAIGRLELLPPRIRKIIQELDEESRKYNERYLNIAVAYGGRAEIVDAIKKIVEDVLAGKISLKDINEELVFKYLYTSHMPYPEPDLVIRTSGEKRISNFLLYQIAYSELVFLDIYWPEITKATFLKAILEYQKRMRRFGS